MYFLLRNITQFTEYEAASASLFLFYILHFLNSLGKELVIIEVIILSALFTCLVMPIAGYHHFNRINLLARVWMRYMPISSEDYYSFMFPAAISMIVGLQLPIFFRKKILKDHREYIENAKQYVGEMKWQGVHLLLIGVISTLIKSFVPSGLSHVFFLLGYLIFVGAFYSLYTQFPFKKAILSAAFGYLLLRSILLGMFGELLYISVMAFILLVLGKKISLMRKLVIFSVGIFAILLLQVIKPEYREQVWYNYTGNSEISVFLNLLDKNISEPSRLFAAEEVWFNFYGRFNQGIFIAKVMNRIPSMAPYANGETIYLSLAASVVPRFLWPDKPESGGKENFRRFIGGELHGYSVGLSPFGEAWGNFGKNGGIVFMFFFGLLFNFIFNWILVLAAKTPSIILWIPVIFFYAVKIESDVLSMVNSMTKACIFAALVYWLYPKFFRDKL